MSASCPSLTKGLDGALLYERDVSFCCLHFTAAAGVVVPFSQVDAFSFCRKCIYVLNSRHVFCCCGYERGILLWRGTLTLKCIWVKARMLLSFFLSSAFTWWLLVVTTLISSREWCSCNETIWFELYIYCRGNIIVCNLDSYRLYLLLFVYLGNNGKGR